VLRWEKGIANDKKVSTAFDKKLEELTCLVQDFVDGKTTTPPYDFEKAMGINVLTVQLDEIIPKVNSGRKIVKEKDMNFVSKHAKYTSRKSRNNTYTIKFEKCSDETFSKIMDSIADITDAKKV